MDIVNVESAIDVRVADRVAREVAADGEIENEVELSAGIIFPGRAARCAAAINGDRVVAVNVERDIAAVRLDPDAVVVVSRGGVVNCSRTGARIPTRHMQGLIVFPLAVYFFRDVNFTIGRPVSPRGAETPCGRPITFAGVREFAAVLKISAGAK